MLQHLLLAAALAAPTWAQQPGQAPTSSTRRPEHDTRATADQAYSQAMQLYALKTPQSIRQAIAKSQFALELYKQLGDRGKQADLLAGMGSAYLAIGEKDQAVQCLREALELTRNLGNLDGQAVVLLTLGSAYESSKQLAPAEETYKQALQLCRSLSNKQGEASGLMALGRVSFAGDDKEKALDWFSQALPLWQTLGDRKNQASALYLLGVLNGLLGREQAAIPDYLQALPLYHDLADRFWEARSLSNLATAYVAVGDEAKAQTYYDQAIPALHAVGDHVTEATALTNRSMILENWGEMDQSLADLTAALNLLHGLGDGLMEATVELRLGIVHYEAGDQEKALDCYRQTLQLARTLNNAGLQAAALVGESSVHQALGDDVSALKLSEEAAKLMPTADSSQGDPDLLYRLGVSYTSLRQNDKALEWFARAAQLQKGRGDRPGEARALQALAGMYDLSGQPQKALDLYQQAFAIRQTLTDQRSKAESLTDLGTVYAELSQPERALDCYAKAREIYQAVHDRVGETRPLFWMAKSEQAMGKLDSAREHIEAALAVTELQRAKLTSREFRTTYLATAQHIYGLYVDLLMQLHSLHPDQAYDAKALEAHERAKARGLLDLLSEAKVDIHQGVDPELLQRELQARQMLEQKQSEEIRRLASGESSEQVRELQHELEGLRAEYQQVESQIRSSSPRYAALTQPQPLDLPAIQNQVLDRDTVLLEYALGEARSYVWVVTPSGLHSYVLPERSQIEKLAVRLYRMIAARLPAGGPDNYQTPALALSGILLAPAREQVVNKRLVIVPDGVLQVVPFNVLPSPGSESYEPLIVEHELVTVPSASTVALLRREVAGRRPAARKVAVFADAVYNRDDGRVAKVAPATIGSSERSSEIASAMPVSMIGLERLSASREEAEGILDLVPPQARLAELDFAANRNNATSPDLAQYQIIHFATHGVVNNDHPELSGIVLSLFDKQGSPQDGFLRLNDLFNLQINADLVVLSACKTALGTEVRGEGLIGLARGFMYAGAPRVVVSLWSVNDQATAEEMRRFYQAILRPGRLRPAAALRQAQIQMWKQVKWHSPFLWAAFELQGDWR